ncbi:hypothetical protein RRG08_007789 [Elysia crispata]|uniref:Uncharacterized protein n=1 Tax=Elysia crispata TaxID=231223 RepID=A0AAE1B271_9GAST|nr:hypothetical protein RRG08_007789 [Elysia crispata]
MELIHSFIHKFLSLLLKAGRLGGEVGLGEAALHQLVWGLADEPRLPATVRYRQVPLELITLTGSNATGVERFCLQF